MKLKLNDWQRGVIDGSVETAPEQRKELITAWLATGYDLEGLVNEVPLKPLSKHMLKIAIGRTNTSPAMVKMLRERWKNEGYFVPEIQPPSMVQRAATFVGSAVSHIASGSVNVPEDVKKQRLSECEQCEFYNRNKDMCLKCGCMMNVKTGWSEQSCPINKWSAWRKTQDGPEANSDQVVDS